MSSDLKNSVFTVYKSANGNLFEMGTGFIIGKKDNAALVLTCNHVISDFRGTETILVERCSATVIASGVENGIDLAILKVEDLQNKPIVNLRSGGGQEESSFLIFGGYHYGKDWNSQLLKGKLGRPAYKNQHISAWDLIMTDGYTLKHGYSGSPVMDERSGEVIGIVDSLENDGSRGRAISIEALKICLKGSEIEEHIRIDCPSDVRSTSIESINILDDCCSLSLESAPKKPEVFSLSLTACFGEHIVDEFAVGISVKKGDLILRIDEGSLSEISMQGSTSCEVHRKGLNTKQAAWELSPKLGSTVLRGEIKKQEIATLALSQSSKCYIEVIFKSYPRSIIIEYLGDWFLGECEEKAKEEKIIFIVRTKIIAILKSRSKFEPNSNALFFSMHSCNL
ncbi:MAG: trypsin-like peptidase domain-containing protein [Oscillatoriophycideae cyanobacterium NC_groundwater_1537_Pr4_S-0.65um_50_18]|nr:trypsin-like peptidase domain-containing protein [Oscillatoriophycideae cyanobacterium NC_groundwater_1537_Pr4_S-0.65um_50_18]